MSHRSSPAQPPCPPPALHQRYVTQSAAFKTLRDRLATACSLHQNLAALPSSSSSSSSSSSAASTGVTSTARGERVQTAQTALTRRGKVCWRGGEGVGISGASNVPAAAALLMLIPLPLPVLVLLMPLLLSWVVGCNGFGHRGLNGSTISASKFCSSSVKPDVVFPLLQGKTQDVSLLLGKFKMAQERHVQARREAFRKKSLQSEASTTTAEK